MFKKYANAVLQDPILKLMDWEKMHGPRSFGQKNASLSKLAANQSKYLLSHCTIMASVQTEPDSEFLVRPTSSYCFNSNDDAWTNEVLLLSYASFRGAFNFVEHFQNSTYAKGHIADSIIRKIYLAPPDDFIYFVDILVMTDCVHEKLCNEIRSGEVKYLSMGCVTDSVDCSFCGARITDANSYCHHLNYLKGTFQEDEDGVPRRIGELCGHRSMPNGGVKFVEASWVAQPAFPGAVKRNIVADNWVGPATPYTTPIEASKAAAFNKAASAPDPAELLLSRDNEGQFLR
jgi:hypothetical protein